MSNVNKYLEKIASWETEGLEKEAGNAAKILRRIEGKKFGEKSKVFDKEKSVAENVRSIRDKLQEVSNAPWEGNLKGKAKDKAITRGAKAFYNREDLGDEIVKQAPKGVKVKKTGKDSWIIT